jgi:hypothetical protein
MADLRLVQSGNSVTGTLQYESGGVTYTSAILVGTTDAGSALTVILMVHASEADDGGKICIPNNFCTQILTLGGGQSHNALSGTSVAGDDMTARQTLS